MNLTFLEVDDQLRRYQCALSRTPILLRKKLDTRVTRGWIFHDLSVEGAIFRDDELERALEGEDGANWRETQLLEKVRRMRLAIGFVKAHVASGGEFDLESIKNIHRHLSAEGDEAGGRYRKDNGVSSAYRHDIVSPKSISYRLRRLVSHMNERTEMFAHPIAGAAYIHRELIEIFPFQRFNGIVARLAMNLWLMRHGYPAVVVPVHDRQSYFDSYLSTNGAFQRLVVRSLSHTMQCSSRALETLAGDRQMMARAA